MPTVRRETENSSRETVSRFGELAVQASRCSTGTGSTGRMQRSIGWPRGSDKQEWYGHPVSLCPERNYLPICGHSADNQRTRSGLRQWTTQRRSKMRFGVATTALLAADAQEAKSSSKTAEY